MNVYFNEITSKPINCDENKIVYKIPAGAMTGNGDLGVVFDQNDTDLVIHVSKCDFWKFKHGAHLDGGIKAVGSIVIKNIDLEHYNVKQYFDEGLLKCKFGNIEAELFVAPQNIIYFELKAPAENGTPAVAIKLPDTCDSLNSEFSENGVTCLTRKFEGEGISPSTVVSVAFKELSDKDSTKRFCVAVASSFDADAHEKKSVEMALNADYDDDKAKTREKWQNFFNASKITIEDKQIEKYYNSSLYHLAGCMGNKGFPPGLFGNFITDDFFPWAGDYHMNYNYEAPYYCIFSANHPELFDGYMVPINEMKENARKFAGFFGCRGYALPVSFGPKALDVFSQADCKEHGVLFLGQKSHAAYASVIPVMHWYATYDKDYALKNYYDFIFNVATFWEDYLVKQNGKYVIKKDAAHEIPFYRGEKFNYITHIGQVNTINSTLSLGLVKMLFKAVYDMSKELGLNTEKLPLWQEISENLSDFPTFIKKGKKCFRYAKFGIRWRNDNTVGLQHIYPASQIGLSSGEKLLKIAKNTYFINDRRLDDNGSNSYLPAGARIGVAPEFLIEGIHQNIKEFALPNGLFRHHGGGIEHLTTIPATINEMLMQSHEGVIRLFPCWDKSSSAAFTNLRANGAFLVSAELKNEKLANLKIKSLKGRKCSVEFPEATAVTRESDNEKINFKKDGDIITFETRENEAYLLS